MKIKLVCLLASISFFAGCATEVAVGPVPPEPVVYYGWYGGYYGPYYWDGPVIIYGAPHGWHGHYYHGRSISPPIHMGSTISHPPTPRFTPTTPKIVPPRPASPIHRSVPARPVNPSRRP